jgi:hypothetical protein
MMVWGDDDVKESATIHLSTSISIFVDIRIYPHLSASIRIYPHPSAFFADIRIQSASDPHPIRFGLIDQEGKATPTTMANTGGRSMCS